MISKTNNFVPIDYLPKMITESMNVENKLALNKPTGDFFYDPWIIKEEFIDTIWDKVLQTIPNPGMMGEARIINLKPGECYYSHADIDDRWHMSIIGHHSYLIDINSRVMHDVPKDGYWYYMTGGHIHSAVNFGEIYRYHLLVRKLLQKAHHTNMIKVTISPAYEQVDYRYQLDNIICPWLNKINKQGLMDNFSFSQNIAKFDLHESQQIHLDNLVTKKFKVYYQQIES